jgi:hypothetical protein
VNAEMTDNFFIYKSSGIAVLVERSFPAVKRMFCFVIIIRMPAIGNKK